MAKCYKILSLCDIIPTDFDGGSGRAAWELSKGLAQIGHKVTLITKGRPERNNYEYMGGIEVHRYFSNPLKLVSIVNKHMSKNKPDLVILHSPLTSLARFLIDKKIPSLYMFYSPWHEEYKIRSKDLKRSAIRNYLGSTARKLIEDTLLKTSSKIIVNSSFMDEKVKMYHKSAPIILPLGVDTERFKPASGVECIRTRHNMPKDKIIIFTLRNLVSRMGLENLIAAAKLAGDSNPNLYFIIGGQGFLKNVLEKQIRELSLENTVRLEGYIGDNEIHEYYQAADIFVLPTRFLEGFGLVTLEALSCGTPVLATPIAANVEVIGSFDETMLFESHEPASIAEGILGYIPKYLKEKPEIRQRCRQFTLENYSWNICVSKLEKIINEALSDNIIHRSRHDSRNS